MEEKRQAYFENSDRVVHAPAEISVDHEMIFIAKQSLIEQFGVYDFLLENQMKSIRFPTAEPILK